MRGLNAEKTEKTDETERIDEAKRIDETDRIGEIEKIDEIERIDKTDRPDLTGIRSRSALRFSNLLVRARGLFRFFGFDDPASVSGVLGFCFHGDSVAVCYLAHHRGRGAYRRPSLEGSCFVLANSEIWQIEEPDGLSVYQRCQRVFDLPVGGPFSQVWVSTNLASGAEAAVSVPGSLHRTLVFSAAQELGQLASRTAADLLGPENGESWLEQAKAEEPPAFDYTLLRVPQEPEAVQPPEKTFSKSASAQARLWWMAGYAASNLLTQLQGHGLAVAGVTPDGVALY
jgi:hypothetical protein